MEDPDHGWKPKNRPQSTIARNFMSELDDLFKIDGGLDSLDKNVHQKKQEVSSHTQQLEALEARLRETEERLKRAKSSPPSRKGSQRRSPIEDAFPDDAKDRLREAGSPSTTRRKPQVGVQTQEGAPGASPDTPTSDNSTEYVMVARPRSAREEQAETA